jgi:hypothetical protein
MRWFCTANELMSLCWLSLMLIASTVTALADTREIGFNSLSSTSSSHTPFILIAATNAPSPRIKPLSHVDLKNGVHLTAHLANGTPALADGLEWSIRRLDHSGIILKEKTPRPALDLPPGEYRANVVAGQLNATQNFSVEAGKVTVVKINFNAGKLDLTVNSGGTKLALENTNILIWSSTNSKGRPIFHGSGQRIEALLPVGEFYIEATLNAISGKKRIRISAGAIEHTTIDLEIGHIIAEARAAEGTEPLSNAEFFINHAIRDKPKISRTGQYGIFAVSPGEYKISAQFGLAFKSQTVQVFANRLTSVNLSLDASRLTLDSISPDQGAGLGAGAPAHYRIFNANNDSVINPLTEIYAALPILYLPAGEFIVEAERDGLIARKLITLRAGFSEKIQLVLAPANVDIIIKEKGRLLSDANVVFSAIPLSANGMPSGPKTDLTPLSRSSLTLPIGKYLLRGIIEPGNAIAETIITLSSGKTDNAEFEFKVGLAKIEVLDKKGGKSVIGASVAIRSLRNNKLLRPTGTSNQLYLAPGRYQVIGRFGVATAKANLTVIDGSETTTFIIPK